MTTAIQLELEAQVQKIELEIQILKEKQRQVQAELRKHVRQEHIKARLGDMNKEEIEAVLKLAEVSAVEG